MLPLEPRNKVPAGKLVRNGLIQASSDPEQVAYWWTRIGYQEANIGLRTGEVFDVLDIDGPTGLTSLASHAPDYKHRGPVSGTGKGHHLLFKATGAPNGANMLPKLDYRGLNGYIVAPPSIHPNGHAYAWLRDPTLPLPEAPDWLRDLVFPRRPERTTTVPRSDAITTALGTLDLISEFQSLGCVLRGRSGNRFLTNCPFHEDDTPSCWLYMNNEPPTFYCFGCLEYGDALNVRNFIATGKLR